MVLKQGHKNREAKEHSLRVKIWGSRGSLPSPLTPADLENQIRNLLEAFSKRQSQVKSDIDSFLRELPRYQLGGYGGNTPCAEVTSLEQQLIIDGGSGIRLLSDELMKGPCGRGAGEVHILFTHFHWDHLIGLPFFTPLFIPGNRINVYAVQSDLEEAFQSVFKKPYFPVTLSQLGAKIRYHRLEPRKKIKLGDISVTPYQLDHPDPCWGYKIEHGGKVYSHCVDTECTRTSRKALGQDLPLYQGVDLMLFDAQYTLVETMEKVNWGHAAASFGLDIAMREGIKRVVFVHHDPASTNEKIAAAESQARFYYDSQLRRAQDSGDLLHSVDWMFGHDGLVLDV